MRSSMDAKDDFTSEDVLHAATYSRLPHLHIRNIDEPLLVRGSGFEALLQQILRHWQLMPRIGHGIEFAFFLKA